MSAEQSNEALLYQLEAVKNETTTWCDLDVFHLKTGHRETFHAITLFEGASYFESELSHILGGDDAVAGMYRRAERPKMTQAGYERFLRAYATGAMPY